MKYSIIVAVFCTFSCWQFVPASPTVGMVSTAAAKWPSLDSKQAEYEVFYFPHPSNVNSFNMSRMLGLINDLRRSQGLHAVEYNDKLLRLAQNHAKFQADFKVVTHADTGGTLGERLSALGFTWNVLAENVGAGASNEKEIFDAWSKSPGHLANLLQPDVRYMGVSVNNGYWVQDFASSGSNTN